MKNYAIKKEKLKHPQRMLISSFKLENGNDNFSVQLLFGTWLAVH